MTEPAKRLMGVIDALSRQYAPRPIPSDPLQLILWENIGYLINDQRRRELFNEFAEQVGFDASAIDAADDAVLFAIAARGGMHPHVRVARWRAVAGLMREVGGDLRSALDTFPLIKARALLKRFPTIGDPGADKILLLCDIKVRPCLESNGLRVLARLGFFKEQPNYAASYTAAIGVLTAQVNGDGAALISAHVLLREHGKTLCRRGEPNCASCVFNDECPKIHVAQL